MRTWTKVGEEIVGSPLNEDCILTRDYVSRAIENIDWIALPATVGAMPGLNISQAIKDLRIPKVSHIGISSELAPYGLYGIRAHYKNGDAEIFLVDAGSNVTVICSDFTAKEATA